MFNKVKYIIVFQKLCQRHGETCCEKSTNRGMFWLFIESFQIVPLTCQQIIDLKVVPDHWLACFALPFFRVDVIAQRNQNKTRHPEFTEVNSINRFATKAFARLS